jgi:hypothetical protein
MEQRRLQQMKKILILFFLLSLVGLGMFSLGLRDSLDGRFFYTSDQAQFLLETMAQDQKDIYFINEIIDLFLLIPLYCLFFISVLQKFFTDSRLLLVPGLSAVLDIFETTNILLTLKTSPQNLWSLLGFVTTLKWTGVGLSLILILMGIFRCCKRGV